MKHKLIALIVAATLLFSFSAYGDAAKTEYTFKKAFEVALKNVPEYKAMDKKIDDTYDLYHLLDLHTPSTVKLDSSDMKAFIKNKVDPQTDLDTAYTSYRALKQMKDNVKRNIELGLREAIIGVSRAEMAVEEVEINKRNLDNQLKLLEIQYDLGMVSRNDYKDNKRKLKDNLKALDDVNKAVDTAYHELNLLLGRKNDRNIKIVLDATEIPLEKLNLEQIKKDMINISDIPTGESPIMLNGFPGSLKILKDDRNIVKHRFSLISDQYDNYKSETKKEDAEDFLEEARRNYDVSDKKYENAMKRFDKTFDDMIEDIKDLYEDIEDLKEEITDEKANQKVYKIEYDQGTMSKIKYESLKDGLTLLENKLKGLEMQLNLNYAKLLAYSDLKKVVIEE